jgi:hypothetical protein
MPNSLDIHSFQASELDFEHEYDKTHTFRVVMCTTKVWSSYIVLSILNSNVEKS